MKRPAVNDNILPQRACQTDTKTEMHKRNCKQATIGFSAIDLGEVAKNQKVNFFEICMSKTAPKSLRKLNENEKNLSETIKKTIVFRP